MGGGKGRGGDKIYESEKIGWGTYLWGHWIWFSKFSLLTKVIPKSLT